MWSSPKFAPKRGTVRGTRRVRKSKPLAPRPAIARPGKVRGAVVDALYASGGRCTLAELCTVLHRKRPRDLVRRKESPKGRDGLLVWLEDANILTVEGDSVTLTDNWLEALDEQRQLGGEIEAEELARKRYWAKSRAYHRRHEASSKSEPSAAGLEAVKRSHEQRQAGLAAIKERAAAAAKTEERRKAEAFVRNRLRELGRIRLALLQDIWHDEGGDPWSIPQAVEALGCSTEKLPEYGDRLFVFAPAEGAA